MKTSKTINPNGLAIVNVLADRKGEVLAFAEIASLANVEPKTGYLTSAKKIAADRKMRIEKVDGGVKAKAHTVTEYPSGLKVEADREIEMDGYRLVADEPEAEAETKAEPEAEAETKAEPEGEAQAEPTAKAE